MSRLSEDLAGTLARAREEGLLLVLTGAGISAESGIPTFRGPEGYWTVGARAYRPEALATRAAFSKMPDEVWAWYLHRRGVCRAVRPNVAHLAIARLEAALGDGVLLVTQNVDGLHLRAGSSRARTHEIHGNIDFHRCFAECSPPSLLPAALPLTWAKDRPVDDATRALLRCERCGGPTRPHVLWFDESYDEKNFRLESSLRAIERASLLLIIGTSGATNLPTQLAMRAFERGLPLVTIGPDETPFSRLSTQGPGAFLQGSATTFVPAVCEALLEQEIG